MSGLLVDASVAIKWVVAEEGSERALALVEEALARRQPIVCPPHLPSEVVNAIYQRTRRGDPALRLSVSDAEAAVAAFLLFDLTIVRPPALYQQALALSFRYQLPTIYDSLYVALAVALDLPLWTADRRLRNSLGTAFPRLRVLA